MTFFVSACGGTSSTGGKTSGGDPTVYTLEELPAKATEALCSKATQCHYFETVEDCEASTDPKIDQITASVEAGKTKYNADKVDECFASLSQELSCSDAEQAMQSDGEAEPCAEVFVGTQEDGKPCFIDEECASAECQLPETCGGMACCEGMCVPTEPAMPPAKIGQPCGDVGCESGSYCPFMMGEPTICTAKVADGQPCTDYDACLTPSTCAFSPQTEMGTCVKPALHGAACTVESFNPCDLNDDYCDATTKICTTRKLPGEACEGFAVPCVVYAYCNAGMCVKQGAAGDACSLANEGQDCLGDLDCLSGKCGFEPEVVCP